MYKFCKEKMKGKEGTTFSFKISVIHPVSFHRRPHPPPTLLWSPVSVYSRCVHFSRWSAYPSSPPSTDCIPF